MTAYEMRISDWSSDVCSSDLKTLGLHVVVDVLLELALVALLIVVGQSLHVLGDVAAVDVLAEGLGVELLGLHVVAGRSEGRRVGKECVCRCRSRWARDH